MRVKRITLEPPEVVYECSGRDMSKPSHPPCVCTETAALSTLSLGDPMGNVGAIYFPPCGDCGSRNFMFRIVDHPEYLDPPYAGSGHDVLRRAINGLAEWLKINGFVDPGALANAQAETPDPSLLAALPYEAPSEE